MPQYRKHSWPALLKAFDESDLTQAKFCSDRNINPKYFSNQRRRYLKCQSVAAPAFIKASLTLTPTAPTSFILKVPQAELHFDTSTSPNYVADLIKALL